MSATLIDKLLQGAEVEWKPLGEITLPTDNIRWKKTERHYRYIDLTSVSRENKTIVDTVEISQQNAPSRAQKLVKKNDILFATTRPTLQRYTIIDEQYSGEVASTGYCVLRANPDEVSPKWIYYNIASLRFNNYVEEHQSGSAYPAISDAKVKDFQIPIPPLSVQEEIVRILDAFTALTAELTSELNKRKKQYNYYRDKLLTFSPDEVEWKTLGEVAKIQRGASPRPINKYITEDKEGIPWIKIGDTSPNTKYVTGTDQKITIEGALKSRLVRKGDFIMSNSMSYGRPYILAIDGAIHDGWASISEFQILLSPDFLYHYLSSQYVKNYWESKINSGSVSNLNSDIIKTLLIPIPSLAEQQRIVDILDKFDALTTSITEGLPREIELRQKQYEYYREQLLNFPKPGAA